MKPSHARRIRFGILAARHIHERHRLTGWQVDDLEGMREVGWRQRDSQKAFDREWINTRRRDMRRKWMQA